MSDIDDFERRESPRGPRSKLEDHAEDILRLHDKRYTLRQIQTFLADSKGIQITEKSICVWLKKQQSKPTGCFAVADKKSPKADLKDRSKLIASGSESPEKVSPASPAEVVKKPLEERQRDFSETLSEIERPAEGSLAEKMRRFNDGS